MNPVIARAFADELQKTAVFKDRVGGSRALPNATYGTLGVLKSLSERGGANSRGLLDSATGGAIAGALHSLVENPHGRPRAGEVIAGAAISAGSYIATHAAKGIYERAKPLWTIQ